MCLWGFLQFHPRLELNLVSRRAVRVLHKDGTGVWALIRAKVRQCELVAGGERELAAVHYQGRSRGRSSVAAMVV